MTTTLSPPVRIFALLGAIAAVGFAAFTLMSGGEATLDTPGEPLVPTKRTSPAPTQTPAQTPATTARRQPTATTETVSGFPLPVDRALRQKRLVVVVLYMPRAGVDAIVRAEAQAAARSSGAGFVAVSALNERVTRPLVAKTGVLPDPAVLVVRRPGVVKAQLGVTDRVMIAQAIAQARR